MCPERQIRVMTFRGGHYERGLQQGKRLRDTFTVPDTAGIDCEFARDCRNAVCEAYPPAIEQFEGMLDGGGFDRDALMLYYFGRLEARVGGCTMFGVSPQMREWGKGPITGRNYDWAVEDLRWCELHRYVSTGARDRIGYTHHWAGCADVLNESGLYVGIASLPPEPVRCAGVQWNIVVDLMSESCENTQDAVSACAAVRHLRPMSYLLADAQGDVAVVEATAELVRVRLPSEGFVTAANARQGGVALRDWSAEQTGLALPEPAEVTANSYQGDASCRAGRRIARAQRLLKDGCPTISESAVKAVLTDHEAPICTGDHSHPDGAPWGTIWSGMCLPAERELRIAPGLPCRHAFQTFTL